MLSSSEQEYPSERMKFLKCWPISLANKEDSAPPTAPRISTMVPGTCFDDSSLSRSMISSRIRWDSSIMAVVKGWLRVKVGGGPIWV